MANTNYKTITSKIKFEGRAFINGKYADAIDGNKFDLRLYVVITGVDPLRVYVFKEGLTRISTSRYSLKNLSDRFAHLTNYSINKKSKEFKKSMANDGDIDIKTLNFEKKAEEADDSGVSSPVWQWAGELWARPWESNRESARRSGRGRSS